MSRLLTRRHFVLAGLTAATIPLLAALRRSRAARPRTAAPAPKPTEAPARNRAEAPTSRRRDDRAGRRGRTGRAD